MSQVGREIDWDALRAAARAAMRRAYAPYSNFPVGAAALVGDGRVVTGCNVENASYGLGLCAECGLVCALHAAPYREVSRPAGHDGAAESPHDHAEVRTRPPRLVAVTVVDRNGAALTPCGRCRQLLWEHGGPDLLLETAGGILPMSRLLPDAFGPEDLIRRKDG